MDREINWKKLRDFRIRVKYDSEMTLDTPLETLENYEELVIFLKALLSHPESESKEVGMDGKLVFTSGAEEKLVNITEVHFNYPSITEENRVAFESDIDGTGFTHRVSDIKEFELKVVSPDSEERVSRDKLDEETLLRQGVDSNKKGQVESEERVEGEELIREELKLLIRIISGFRVANNSLSDDELCGSIKHKLSPQTTEGESK